MPPCHCTLYPRYVSLCRVSPLQPVLKPTAISKLIGLIVIHVFLLMYSWAVTIIGIKLLGVYVVENRGPLQFTRNWVGFCPVLLYLLALYSIRLLVP